MFWFGYEVNLIYTIRTHSSCFTAHIHTQNGHASSRHLTSVTKHRSTGTTTDPHDPDPGDRNTGVFHTTLGCTPSLVSLPRHNQVCHSHRSVLLRHTGQAYTGPGHYIKQVTYNNNHNRLMIIIHALLTLFTIH